MCCISGRTKHTATAPRASVRDRAFAVRKQNRRLQTIRSIGLVFKRELLYCSSILAPVTLLPIRQPAHDLPAAGDLLLLLGTKSLLREARSRIQWYPASANGQQDGVMKY